MAKADDGSILLIDECFSREDDNFLVELRKFFGNKALAGFVDRWKKDPRPWARRQIFEYLDMPLDRPGHQPVVKRLFKQAEETQDDELMAAFMVALDRLIRRVRKTRYHWDWNTGNSWQEEILHTPRNSIPQQVPSWRNPRTGEVVMYLPRGNPRLFSYRTRYYLRRRAWRYFRRLGFQRPNDYPAAIARALARYRDEDLANGEDVLESWGLVQACFRGHDALDFGASNIRLKDDRSLGELSPAPRFPELWQKPESLTVLLDLLSHAQSRLVRVWTMEMIRRDHKENVAGLSPDVLLKLLDHEDQEIQELGAELLENLPSLATLPIETWLRLLKTKSPTALATICDIMARHVSEDRLSLGQCVDLACEKATPVAQIGFNFLKKRTTHSENDRQELTRLADTECEALGTEIAKWTLAIVGSRENYELESVLPFFDSLLIETREGAWQWLVDDSAGYDDPALWSRLLETPFGDVRLRLIEQLQKRSQLPGASADDLSPVWCSVLLGVHRGGRQKPKVAAQIAEALVDKPDRAASLLPVLAVAIRSIRGPEMRAGLAAIVGAVESRPELAAAIRTHLPELNLEPEGVT